MVFHSLLFKLTRELKSVAFALALIAIFASRVSYAQYARHQPAQDEILFQQHFGHDFDVSKEIEASSCSVSVDTVAFFSHPSSLRVIVAKEGNARLSFKPIPIVPGQFVEAECKIKVEDLCGEASIELNWLKNGELLSSSIGGSPHGPVIWRFNPVSGTADWQTFYARGFAPSEVDSFAFSVISSNEGGGKIWLDDIKVYLPARSKVEGEIDRNPICIDPESLKPEHFVIAKDGHLYLREERVRFWGAQSNMVSATHRDMDLEIERFKDLGFNAHRTLWWHPEVSDYTKGDNSIQDKRDYLIAALGRKGIHIWSDFLNSCQIKPEHSAVIEGPDAEEWAEAIKQIAGDKGYVIVQGFMPLAWDARSQKVYHEYIKRVLNHKNQYNGLRYCEDPAFFCWELTNEEWMLMRLLWGQHLSLPAYFQKSLYDKWNNWLKTRYSSDNELREAWNGLLEGESLEKNSVFLLPLFGDSNPSEMAKTLGLNVSFEKLQYSESDFSPKRLSDVLAFIYDLIISYKKESEKVFRAQGRPQIGSQIVPLIYDTGYAGALMSLYLQSQGSATTVAVYVDLVSRDLSLPTFPFTSELKNPPNIHPWFANRKLAGKPAFVYETMVFNPQKYKIEWPWRVMAWASIMDYDAVFWHYYGHPLPKPDIQNSHSSIPLQNVLSYNHWNGTHMKYDEALMAAAKAAGAIFSKGYLNPASNPVRIIVGREKMHTFDGVFGSSYHDASSATALQRGVEWVFDPNREKDEIIGELITPAQAQKTPVVSPTSQITYFWKKGFMQIDDPRAKAVVGFLPKNYHFSSGVKINGIKINNPPGMPFVIRGERYGSIAIVSCDGKPLQESCEILISSSSSSFNSGFELDLKKIVEDKQYAFGLANSIINDGGLPVLTARLGFELEADWLKGRAFKMFDYNGDLISEGRISTSKLRVPDDMAVFKTIITP